jgi:hypothetical protein
MADLSLEWPASQTLNGDFAVDATGDLLTCSLDTEARQRVTRRLLTNQRQLSTDGLTVLPPDYIFDPTYGCGLRRLVGAAVNSRYAQQIKQTVLDGVLQEDVVAANPPPQVVVQSSNAGIGSPPPSGGFLVAVTFTSASTARPVSTPRISLS